MAVVLACSCSYTAKVPESFLGRQVTCPRCTKRIVVNEQGSPVAAAAPEIPHVIEKCPSCSSSVSPKDPVCSTCGWDTKKSERTCLKCKGPVIPDDGPGIGGFAGGTTGVAGFLFFFLFGPVLGGAIVAGASAMCGFLSACTMQFKCGMCGMMAGPSVLSKDEQQSLSARRTKFLLVSGGLAALAFVLFVVYFVAILPIAWRR